MSRTSGVNEYLLPLLCMMPCKEMKELEVALSRYSERRKGSAAPEFERRKMSPGWLRVGLARAAYMRDTNAFSSLGSYPVNSRGREDGPSTWWGV